MKTNMQMKKIWSRPWGKHPHLWLDPVYSIDMAKTIKDELTKKCRNRKNISLTAISMSFPKSFEALDEKFATSRSSRAVPIRSSFPISAYGYWEERYDWNKLASQD